MVKRSQSQMSTMPNQMSFKDPQLLSYLIPNGPVSKMRSGVGNLASYKAPNIHLKPMTVAFPCQPMPPMSGAGAPSCKLSLQFDGAAADLSDDQKILADLLQATDAQAIEYIVANSKAFFPKKKNLPSAAAIKEMYTPSFKDKSDEYNPLFSMKVEFKGDAENYEITVPCFNAEREQVPGVMALGKGAEVTAVVEPAYLWSISGKFGITWRLKKALVNKMGSEDMTFDFDLFQ